MSSITLYHCTEDVLRALDQLADNEEQWAQDTIEAVIGQFEQKAVAVTAYMLNTDAQIDLLDAHIKAMQAKKKTLQNSRDSLKHYLAINMQRTGIREIKANDGTFTAKFAKNPPSIEILDEKQIPEQYWRTQVEKSVDKTAIKSAINAGENVPGATLVTDKESLRIK